MYKPIVFGCIALIFAWPLVGLLALGIDEDTVVVSEMIVVTVFLVAVDAFWWWMLVFKDYAGPPGAVLEFKFWQSLGLYGVMAGFWLFGPLTDGYSDYAWLWIVLALGPIAILVVRMMMGFAGWKR